MVFICDFYLCTHFMNHVLIFYLLGFIIIYKLLCFYVLRCNFNICDFFMYTFYEPCLIALSFGFYILSANIYVYFITVFYYGIVYTLIYNCFNIFNFYLYTHFMNSILMFYLLGFINFYLQTFMLAA